MVNTKLHLGLLHTANNLVLTNVSLILPPQERSLHIPATYNFQILSNYENQNRTPLNKKKKKMENWQTTCLCQPTKNRETCSPSSPEKSHVAKLFCDILCLLCPIFWFCIRLCQSLKAQELGTSVEHLQDEECESSAVGPWRDLRHT